MMAPASSPGLVPDPPEFVLGIGMHVVVGQVDGQAGATLEQVWVLRSQLPGQVAGGHWLMKLSQLSSS